MTAENKPANAVGNFFKEQKIGQALRQSNFSKQKGFPCKDLLQFLVMLVFTGKNLFRYLQSDAENAPFQKDAIYRLLNGCHYNWRRFLLLVSSQIIRGRIVPLTENGWLFVTAKVELRSSFAQLAVRSAVYKWESSNNYSFVGKHYF